LFGLTFDKLVVIGIIALFVIGPQRLPVAAAKLAQLVKTVRNLTDTAKERVREEMGPDFDDVDWQKLDPRQYDPRRIIREALLDDDDDDSSAPKVTLAKKSADVVLASESEESEEPVEIGVIDAGERNHGSEAA
jgi:sec-independent protein translocase protein TatB